MPVVALCAAASKGNTASDAKSASAQAQTRAVIRMRPGIPVFSNRSSRPGAGYRGHGRNFKPSGSRGPNATAEISSLSSLADHRSSPESRLAAADRYCRRGIRSPASIPSCARW